MDKNIRDQRYELINITTDLLYLLKRIIKDQQRIGAHKNIMDQTSGMEKIIKVQRATLDRIISDHTFGLHRFFSTNRFGLQRFIRDQK